jgi:hypothetical protein
MTASLVTVADEVVLRGGGKIEGVLLDHRCNENQLVLRVRDRDLTMRPDSMVRYQRIGSAAQRYDQLRPMSGDSFDEHWQLALWCRANGLTQTEAEHVARCVRLKPDAAEARARLDALKAAGQVVEAPRPAENRSPPPAAEPAAPPPPAQDDGDDAAPAEGRDRPRPGTPEYREAVRHRQAMDKRIARIASQIRSKSAEAAAAARQDLQTIHDEAAVPALARILKTLNEDDRMLVLQVIGGTAGAAADEALTGIALTDPSAEIRLAATELLQARPLDAPSYARPLIGALTCDQPEWMYNAAELCAAMDEKGAVPLLIEGLHTPVRSGVLLSGSVGDPWFPVGTLLPPSCVTPTGRTYGIRYSSASGGGRRWYPGTRGAQMEKERRFYLVTAGPALAGSVPGQVLTSPRFTPARPQPSGRPPSGGGGEPQPKPTTPARFAPAPSPRVETIASMYRHEPMLQALRRLTKKDFGFDQAAWRRWWAREGAKELGLTADDETEPADDSPKKRSVPERPPEKPAQEPAPDGPR